MRRLVSCHYLTGIGEDGGGEQAEGIDAWVGYGCEGELGSGQENCGKDDREAELEGRNKKMKKSILHV